MICPDISADDFTQLCSAATVPTTTPTPAPAASLLPCCVCVCVSCYAYTEAICRSPFVRRPCQAIVLDNWLRLRLRLQAGDGEECMLSALLSCLCNRAVVKGHTHTHTHACTHTQRERDTRGHMSSLAARFISAKVSCSPLHVLFILSLQIVAAAFCRPNGRVRHILNTNSWLKLRLPLPPPRSQQMQQPS